MRLEKACKRILPRFSSAVQYMELLLSDRQSSPEVVMSTSFAEEGSSFLIAEAIFCMDKSGDRKPRTKAGPSANANRAFSLSAVSSACER